MRRIGAGGIAVAGGDLRASLRHLDAVLPIPPPADRAPAPAMPLDAAAWLR